MGSCHAGAPAARCITSSSCSDSAGSPADANSDREYRSEQIEPRCQWCGHIVRRPPFQGVLRALLSKSCSGAKNILHLVYPTPRGMLPSVRSLIDYLLIHVSAWLQERSI
jgi:hypothetical protein